MCGFIRKMQRSDIEAVALGMRAADALEVWRHDRSSPLEAIQKSVDNSALVWTFVGNGQPAALFGVAPECMLSSSACLWLLGTDEINRCKLSFLKASRIMVARLLQMYPVLYNHVDIQYESAHKWLEWLGAEFLGQEPYGAEGEIFKFFVIRRK